MDGDPITKKRLDNTSCSPIAKYDFNENADKTIISDSSGLEPPVNLTIQDSTAISWLGNGLAINSSTVAISDRSQNTANRLTTAIRSSNELTVETWIKPANATQSGPARIVSLSVDYGNRNMTIGQVANTYILRLRTSTTNENGKVNISSGDINPITTAAGTARTELTHLVLTWDTTTASANYFINGSLSASATIDGDFSPWSDQYPLLLANELIDGRTWLGKFYYLAIYDCAIEGKDISEKYVNGIPGKN